MAMFASSSVSWTEARGSTESFRGRMASRARSPPRWFPVVAAQLVRPVSLAVEPVGMALVQLGPLPFRQARVRNIADEPVVEAVHVPCEVDEPGPLEPGQSFDGSERGNGWQREPSPDD